MYLKTFLKIFILIFLSSELSWGTTLKLNPIEVKNRAQCAIDSQLPTQSVFLIVDGYNPGRIAYNFSKSANLNSRDVSLEAMVQYQKSIALAQTLIIEKLINNKIPLLKSNLENFKTISKNCNNEAFCPPLSSYLDKLWKAETKSNLFQIDNFSSENFLSENVEFGCYFLKNFSPLQSHLLQPEVDREQLSSLGRELTNPKSLIHCSDKNISVDPTHYAIQLDILTNSKQWEKIGFEFWSSLKIYTSWAMRYAPEIQKEYGKFQQLFRNIDFEESLLYVSNGCKSITAPKCNNENLALNSLRELSKIKVQSEEFDRSVPTALPQELLNKGPRDVNNDFLSLMEFDKATEWISNFKNNLSSQQWVYRNKILNAHQNVSLIASQLSPQDLSKALNLLTQKSSDNNLIAEEILYLCTEWNLSSNPDFDFIRSDLQTLTQITQLQSYRTQHGLTLEEIVSYFQILSTEIKPICDQMRNKYQNSNFNPKALHSWAQEILKPIHKNENSQNSFSPFEDENFKALTFISEGTSICQNAADCSRFVIKSVLDLYQVSTFAKAFIFQNEIPSAELFNPYNELLACEIYDPWFQKKRTRKRLATDLMNTAFFGWNNIPAYFDVDFSPPRVTSFKQLIENGSLKFSPEVEKSKAQFSMLADLGPLAGAPCAVQVSPNSDKAFNFYAFGGISINACLGQTDKSVNYQNARNKSVSTPEAVSGCGGCTINLIGVSSAYSKRTFENQVNPLKFGIYMFRAFYRFFKGMKDPVNIPRSATLDLNLISSTFQKYGDIPSQCVKPITDQKECRVSYCEGAASIYFEQATGNTFKNMRVSRVRDVTKNKDGSREVKVYQEAQIKDQECNNMHSLKFICDEAQRKIQFLDLETNFKCSPGRSSI